MDNSKLNISWNIIVTACHKSLLDKEDRMKVDQSIDIISQFLNKCVTEQANKKIDSIPKVASEK